MTLTMKILKVQAFGTLYPCHLKMEQGVELTGNRFNSIEFQILVVLELVQEDYFSQIFISKLN